MMQKVQTVLLQFMKNITNRFFVSPGWRSPFATFFKGISSGGGETGISPCSNNWKWSLGSASLEQIEWFWWWWLHPGVLYHKMCGMIFFKILWSVFFFERVAPGDFYMNAFVQAWGVGKVSVLGCFQAAISLLYLDVYLVLSTAR